MTTEDKTYNGWKNYETWNVALWLGNDSNTADYIDEMLEGTKDISEAADMLKDYVEEQQPDLPASMFVDLLNAALCEVDWYEIAKTYLDNRKEEETA